ncbi:hypothetical protein [Pelagicoccus sp. SDUM812003]|uniref:hypothetical protein n=1 Tax=Pelagicoccus sp. SDUM812003 TaxID=3041267 RepID=UPI00280E7329|nr:hypothetical protein [Pelagicoccus sp. SDUM812003]MDQ8205570.1 hypothetical protein [Pelagicoccus sp. SDUM812003]
MSTPERPEPTNKHLPHSMRTREPWPMWPIALAIVLFIGVYTYIQLSFRKEGPAFEPFQAMMDRKNAVVEKNMYDWYGLTAVRSSDQAPIPSPAEVSSRAYEEVLDEVVPEQLKYYMPGKPILVPGFVKVESPSTLTPGERLRLRLFLPEGIANDERVNLLSFYKEGDLYLLPSLFVEKRELVANELLQGEPTPVAFEFPTDPIDADTVTVRFLTEGRLSTWSMANLDPSAAIVEQDQGDL